MYYIHADPLGRPQKVTNGNQTVVWQARNYAFHREVDFSTFGELNIGFPGQYYDDETNLYYNWHRYYDPSTGRYTQSDPIGLVGGNNTYAYAGANPLSWIDPFGLAPCPPREPPLESVCPECYVMGLGRLAYAGLAKLIPAVSGALTRSPIEQGAMAVAMRNSLKDGFRMPLTPIFAGMRQPTFSSAMGRYSGDVGAIIEASARTNTAVNAMGATGVALGMAAGHDPNSDLGVMAGYQDPCGCD